MTSPGGWWEALRRRWRTARSEARKAAATERSEARKAAATERSEEPPDQRSLLEQIQDASREYRRTRYLWSRLDDTPQCGRDAPKLEAADRARVDERFARAVENVGDMQLAIVLSEEPAGEESSYLYVYYEPLADLVIALSTTEKRASITATHQRWDALRPELEGATNRITRALEQDRVVDALLLSIDEAEQILESFAKRPDLPR